MLFLYHLEIKMSSEVTNINERKVVLPTWLDTLIFNDLSANYCRQNKDMVVLEWNFDDIKKYLGTYFPRSYAESFCIFSNFFSTLIPQHYSLILFISA